MLKIEGATPSEARIMKKVERALFKHLGQSNFFETFVSLADEDVIKEVNRQQRNVDMATDVLSFPCFEGLSLPVREEDFSDADREGKRVMLGSIMICRKKAISQAEELGHSYKRELGFLICHGLLHLLGFDHIERDDEEIMTAHQRAVMDAVGFKA